MSVSAGETVSELAVFVIDKSAEAAETGTVIRRGVVVGIRVRRVRGQDCRIHDGAGSRIAHGAPNENHCGCVSLYGFQIERAGPGQKGRAIVQAVFRSEELGRSYVCQNHISSVRGAKIGNQKTVGDLLTRCDWGGRCGFADSYIR